MRNSKVHMSITKKLNSCENHSLEDCGLNTFLVIVAIKFVLGYPTNCVYAMTARLKMQQENTSFTHLDNIKKLRNME